jgi:hypothetical protein
VFVTHDKYIETADEILDRFNDHRIDTVEGMRLLKCLNRNRNERTEDVADVVELIPNGVRTIRNTEA